jgi:Flp pilus assembly protein TadD
VGDLAVTVLVHGNVVDDRVVPVRRMIRLGESDDAAVAFPGVDLAVVRVGRGLALRGRVLEEGEEMSISLGHVEVRLLHTVRGGAFPLEWGTFLDKRFLAAAIVATVSGTWLDTAESWVERHGPALGSSVVDTFLDTMEGRGAVEAKAVVAPDTRASENARPAEESRTQGPRHESDDRLTGIGYYTWYRAAVMADAAHESWGPADRTDVAARRRLARAAYDRDDWDSAAWHYRWLVEHAPDDRTAKLHLAWAERRRGQHDVEVALYKEILAVDPDDALAESGLALALARLGRMGEAKEMVDDLQVKAPMDPYTDLTIAMVAAVQGHDEEALQALDKTLGARAQLSDELQVELRRDLAIDPMLSSLRKNRRMSAILRKHLGAGAPRPEQ